jgi:predicted O-methyltransferase YrrM
MTGDTAEGDVRDGPDFAAIDRALADGSLRFDAALAHAYGSAVLGHPLAADMARVKTRSMLGVETLLMLRAFALEARGSILEIGPYIGGSTIALAMGVAAGRAKPLVSIDACHPNLLHPQLPSSDVAADWHANLASEHCLERATLVQGFTNDPAVAARARAKLGDGPVGLLVIDADGRVWRNTAPILDWLADGCLLVFDDYTNLFDTNDIDAQNAKFAITRQSIHHALAEGVIEHYGTFMWGTWFGRLRSGFREAFPQLLAAEEERSA